MMKKKGKKDFTEFEPPSSSQRYVKGDFKESPNLNEPPKSIFANFQGDKETKEQYEQTENDTSDSFKLKGEVSARIIPSSERVTNPAINDSPSDRDSIGFTPYVQALSRMIIHPKTMTPLTIGIMGPWGSGKTSFMKQVKANIKSLDKNVKHVEFNAWKYEVQEKLWAAFLQKIVLQIENDLCWGQKKRLKIRSIWKKLNIFALLWNFVLTAALFIFAFYIFQRFNVELKWSLIILIPFGALAVFLNPLTDLWKKWKMPLGIDIAEMFSENHIAENITNFIEFESDLNRILDQYIGNKGRLVIYIDDLDRCSPNKVVDVLETINVFLDTDRCIFLLGLDQPKVVMAINVKFKDHIELMDKSNIYIKSRNDFGEGFLEKIIQVPIYVPKLGKEYIDDFLEGYFDHKEIYTEKEGQKKKFSNLDELKDIEMSAEAEIVLKNSVGLIDSNPRSIKKYMNIFRYVHLLYLVNRDKLEDVNEDYLPIWFLISYQYKKDMPNLEKKYYDRTWQDLLAEGDLTQGIQNLYQNLKNTKEVKKLNIQPSGPLKGYFQLTRLLYDPSVSADDSSDIE